VILVPVAEIAEKLEELKKNGDHIDLKVYGMIEMAKNLLQE